MAGDLSRFLRLERARQEGVEGAVPDVTDRFQAEPPHVPTPPPGEEAPSLADALREQRQKDLETGLTLETAESREAQPFMRCGYCETDNGKFATRCSSCERPLDTPEQRAFNEQLWNTRLIQEQVDTQERERLREARAAPDLAPATGEERAARPGAPPRPLWWIPEEPRGSDSTGLRLLRLIPDPKVRFGVAISLLGLGCYALYRWFNAPPDVLFNRWELLFFVVGLLFIPRGVFRRR